MRQHLASWASVGPDILRGTAGLEDVELRGAGGRGRWKLRRFPHPAFQGRGGAGGSCAASATSAMAMMPSAASSRWPTIRRLLPFWRRNTAAVGSLIAIASPSQACGPPSGVPARRRRRRISLQERIAAHDGRHVPFEHDLPVCRRSAVAIGQVANLAADTPRAARRSARRPGTDCCPPCGRWRRCKSLRQGD